MAGTIPQEIQRINGEVATQAAKIAQLSTILDGKAAGGGGASVELVTFTCTSSSISAGLAEFAFYDEASSQWSYCKGNDGLSDLNVDKGTYKVMKNGYISFLPYAFPAWSFSPQDAIEIVDYDVGVIRVLSDVSATLG